MAEAADDEEISVGRRAVTLIRDGVLILLAAMIVFGAISALYFYLEFRGFDW